LIGEYDATGGLIEETVWLGDLPVAVLKPNGTGISVYYVHTDHLNTPRRISRPSDNAILWRWDSDPFGTTAANDDADGDTIAFTYHHRFPGQYLDDETGLHYNYFRDYDAVTGRYIQSDPIGLLGGINTYQYVASNPVLFVDALGLAEFIGNAALTDLTDKMRRVIPLVDSAVAGVIPTYAEAVVISTTGGRHNSGSRHATGNAIDLRVWSEPHRVPANFQHLDPTGYLSKEQVDDLVCELQTALGEDFLVRNELTRPRNQKVWSGPHIHIEVRVK
jgi:RHS repeat-associated protein